MARKPDSHHVLPLFCDDLIASTVEMTPACFGAYVRLLCYAWTRGGIPDNEAACSRITGGMEPGDWAAIRSRLMVLEDGRLSHQRLELERVAVAEIREQRSEAGKMGNAARWGSQTGSQSDRKRIAKRSQTGSQSDRKSIAPNPSPSLPCSSPQEEETHTHTDGSSEFRKPGWAADAWADFLATWNATDRAQPWRHLSPPDGWVDLAATPGWLQRAGEAMEMLPSRMYFETPLPLTRFFDYLDRIRAGEFAEPKDGHKARKRQPAGGNL